MIAIRRLGDKFSFVLEKPSKLQPVQWLDMTRWKLEINGAITHPLKHLPMLMQSCLVSHSLVMSYFVL